MGMTIAAAIEVARRQHEALYVDIIETFITHTRSAGRYGTRTPVLVTQGEYRALVQVSATMSAAVAPGVEDSRLTDVVVKTDLSTPVAPGMWVVVRRCDLTPTLVGRWFRITDDDLQSLAVTLRFHAVQSTPAGVRPPTPEA